MSLEMLNDKEVLLLGDYLKNQKNPLKGRFRALFALKGVNSSLAIERIAECLSDPSDLLKHELAYCLGQMMREESIPILEKVIRNKENNVMVRHEAGEALGAIGTPASLAIVTEFVNDPAQAVAETCQLALKRISQAAADATETSGLREKSELFNSIDPAFPLEESQVDGPDAIEKLTEILVDNKLDLYERYRAMFSLRNMNTPQAAFALCNGFKCPESALFRHEIAFVLGQLRHRVAFDSLLERLEDVSEEPMVRHECAEALGAIGTKDCLSALKKFLNDPEPIVRESCEIALDICEYEMNDDFQYADARTIITETFTISDSD